MSDDGLQDAARKAAESQRRYDEEQDRDYARTQAALPPRSFPGVWSFAPVATESGAVAAHRVTYEGALVGLVVRGATGLHVIGGGGDHDTGPRTREILAAWLLANPAS